MLAASSGSNRRLARRNSRRFRPFDEIHHDVVHHAVRIDLVDLDDVRVLELHPELAFAAEQLDVRLERLAGLRVGALRIAEAAAQHLHGVHLAGLVVHCAKHAGKRAGADAIQHLVIAVEEAGPRLGLHQLLELILRQQLAAQESLLKGGQRRGRAQLAPHGLSCALVDDAHVQSALGQLFRGFDFGHGTLYTGGMLTRPRLAACHPTYSIEIVNSRIPAASPGYSSRSRRVASKSNIKYFMSSRNWLNASCTSDKIRRRRLVLSTTRSSARNQLAGLIDRQLPE